jgi:hypothetical protein
MSRDQNAGRSHIIKIDNSPFQGVEDLRYFGTTITHQNSIREEIQELTEARECLLSFGAVFSVFQVAIQKFKD